MVLPPSALANFHLINPLYTRTVCMSARFHCILELSVCPLGSTVH